MSDLETALEKLKQEIMEELSVSEESALELIQILKKTGASSIQSSKPKVNE